MASIDLIRASDGSGNANVATVQSSRSGGSSTIVVDTVAGISDFFMGSMGTPHTFTDPITSETITVISDATAVDFAGHVDGVNLEIDTIAPGYVDGGSEIGDIVIVRPTTQWGDNVADVLDVSHDDDGTLKAGAVDSAAVLAANVVETAKILDSNVTTGKVADEAITSRKLAPKIALKPCTGDVTLNSTSYADITGCTLTFTPDIASYARVWGIIDYRAASTVNDEFQVDLDVDGVNQTPIISYKVPTSAGRFVMSQCWLIPVTAAAHTIKLEGKRLSGSGTVVVEADSSRMIIELMGNDNITVT